MEEEQPIPLCSSIWRRYPLPSIFPSLYSSQKQKKRQIRLTNTFVPWEKNLIEQRLLVLALAIRRRWTHVWILKTLVKGNIIAAVASREFNSLFWLPWISQNPPHAFCNDAFSSLLCKKKKKNKYTYYTYVNIYFGASTLSFAVSALG